MNEAIDQAIKRAKTIDVHAHVVLAESMHSAGVYGPEIGYNSDGAPWFRIGESKKKTLKIPLIITNYFTTYSI